MSFKCGLPQLCYLASFTRIIRVLEFFIRHNQPFGVLGTSFDPKMSSPLSTQNIQTFNIFDIAPSKPGARKLIFLVELKVGWSINRLLQHH